MKVKELIEILEKMPQSAVIYNDDNCGGAYMLRDVEYDKITNEIILS